MTTVELSDVGKRVFGRPLRLLTAVWILDHKRFYQAEATEGVRALSGPDGARVDQAAVTQELDRFVDLKLIDREDKEGGQRRQYYGRLDTPLWSVFEAARDSAPRI
jgi:hypothetical protein